MAELIASNPAIKAALLLALFFIVGGLAFALALTLGAREELKQRLATPDAGGGERVVLSPSLRAHQTGNAWAKLVDRIEQAGLSLVDTKDAALRQRLVAAGYTAPYAPRLYTFTRLVLVVALPLIALLLVWLSGSAPGIVRLYFTLIIPAALGLYLPSLFIRAKADRRQGEIVNGFPDALDLMLVCVEAGVSLEAAFDRVGKEMTLSHPLVAEQFGMVVLELRAGRSREDALRRLGARTGTDEVRAFATLLIQSTSLGTSIATTLRIYAAEMRERRRMRAEEKAHRLPVLLSIPLVACMLPVMIGVLMLPAVIRVVRTLVPALHGG